ncbi:hypothetical protein SEPCBS57363_000082 [Sporothrix epigloea]|uniref:Pathway-specific nitrogen regulator n=1 Tax=Sporothrix epigloea TaxID=1892477 RepID=A0ABP0D2P6_9PEZI
MADDILLDHTVTKDDEVHSGVAVLENHVHEKQSEEKKPALTHDNTHDTDKPMIDEPALEDLDDNNHSVPDIEAAIDAFPDETHETTDESQSQQLDEQGNNNHAFATESTSSHDEFRETDATSNSIAAVQEESQEAIPQQTQAEAECQDQSHIEENPEEACEKEQIDLSMTHDNLSDKEQSPHQDSRRSSASSYRSEVSNRRTSLRTEALIQAAARAVVAKINEKNSTDDDFDIGSTLSESHEEPHYDYDQHTATDEEGEIDYEQDVDFDENDDVFSDRSPRSSLGSFEHNSGASSNGASEDPRNKDHSDTDAVSHMGIENEHDFVDETGSVAYHDRRIHEDRHRSPRLSTVSGISHMSDYEQHQAYEEEEYDNDEELVHQTVRDTPRAAFRTPSSVRAIQMSSPSPSVIFGVSPRSAARRRRLGTGIGMDDGHSMGSVGTTSSLPGPPSKSQTPTRFKVFRKPEPAPLVLLHATVMPTRWVWSDVLRTLDEQLSSTAKSGRAGLATPSSKHMDASSFEPSAALMRLHGAWCRLQEYSFGGDTVAERGVLLPHPQNDYEVLEEKLLEALELPVRRRARILECGHYLGPADEDDEESDDESDDYPDVRPGYRDESDSPKKRHWCKTCHSDIRFESLGAERVFRVKVYASNGLMTIGAWAACWSEMERVDVEVEPIVADAELLRELNQLRTLQQQEALYRQEVEKEAAVAAAAMADTDIEDGKQEDREKLMEQGEDEEFTRLPAAAGRFRPATPNAIPLPSALRESPVSRPTTSKSRRSTNAERRQREAEERLREIYGQTPPQAKPAVPTSQSYGGDTTPLSDVPEADRSETTRDLEGENLTFKPPPPSLSAAAYERREERRSHQFSTFERGIYNNGAADAASFDSAAYTHQPQTPYDSASLLELLVAAGKVFIRDRKHVAITVLSILVIVLATLRAPSVGYVGVTAAVPQGLADFVAPRVLEAHPGADHRQQIVRKEPAVLGGSMVNEAARRSVPTDTMVETVIEKMTVKVFETVTETATSTKISTATATATGGFKSTGPDESALVDTEEILLTSTPMPSLTAKEEAESLFAATCASGSFAEPSLIHKDESVPISHLGPAALQV